MAGADLAAGCAGLEVPDPTKCSPREFLLSNVSGDTESWHEFGMEWKEHIAWIAPMLATSAAIVIGVYRRRLADEPRIRRIAITMFVMAFVVAAVAGVLGALITKVAPVK
jgi:heme A synthase